VAAKAFGFRRHSNQKNNKKMKEDYFDFLILF